MDKKGQSALEYLMTYGWALVVIIVVIGALVAFNVINPPTPSTCIGFPTDFAAYKEHKLDGSGSLEIAIIPAKQIKIRTIVFADSTLTTLSYSNMAAIDDFIDAGVQIKVIGSSGPTGTAGQSYTGKKMVITYDTENLTGLTASATCSGTYSVTE